MTWFTGVMPKREVRIPTKSFSVTAFGPCAGQPLRAVHPLNQKVARHRNPAAISGPRGEDKRSISVSPENNGHFAGAGKQKFGYEAAVVPLIMRFAAPADLRCP